MSANDMEKVAEIEAPEAMADAARYPNEAGNSRRNAFIHGVETERERIKAALLAEAQEHERASATEDRPTHYVNAAKCAALRAFAARLGGAP